MKRDSEKIYLNLIKEKKYNLELTEKKFKKLEFKPSELNLFQLKSAIIYLSRFEDEIDQIIKDANNNALSILNAATVKQERSKS